MGICTWLVVGCAYSCSCYFDLCVWRKNRLKKISNNKARRKLQFFWAWQFMFLYNCLKIMYMLHVFLKKVEERKSSRSNIIKEKPLTKNRISLTLFQFLSNRKYWIKNLPGRGFTHTWKSHILILQQNLIRLLEHFLSCSILPQKTVNF